MKSNSAKDTFFNATLIGVALLVVAHAVVSGNLESEMPRHDAPRAEMAAV